MTELLKPIFSAAPESIDFGNVPLFQTASESLWVYNSGGVDLHVSLSPDPSFSVAPSSATVPPRQGRGFRISFTPDVADTFAGVIRILHDDPARTDSLVVQGRGLAETTVTL